MKSVELAIPGKCILVGEHAVLRGKPAIVFPLKSRRFILKFRPGDRFRLQCEGPTENEVKLVFQGVLEKALELANKPDFEIKGEFNLSNSIPVGGGLGASAALCASIGRFFEIQEWIRSEEVHEFSRQLENIFHGESSGVDIAVALKGVPIRFVRNQSIDEIITNWNPLLYVSYVGHRGLTSDCVKQVQLYAEREPLSARATDEEMAKASEMAMLGLQKSSSDGALDLVEAINRAAACFERWGLVDVLARQHMDDLKRHGALAAKPTGSGGGGHILSLWRQPPTGELSQKLIPVFGV